MITRAITIIGFACAISGLVTLQVLARKPGSRIPTLGTRLGYIMRPRTGRVLVLLGWLWPGWHYFAR